MPLITRAAFVGLFLLALSPAVFAEDAKVSIDNFTFTPAEITVQAGTNVEWTNNDDIPHTVTDANDPKTNRSPALDTGDTYARQFDKPGRYEYFCALHPHMRGTLIVK